MSLSFTAPARLLLLLCFLSLWAMPSYASKTLAIYNAQTLVKNQSEAERNRAARATLGEVVVRVSGQRDALTHPQIKEAISRAEHYLFGFSYRASDERIQEGEKSLKALTLQLEFSPAGIQQLLRSAGLPLWPAQRPQLLLWPWVKDAGGLRLALDEDLQAALRARAAYRGLPLTFAKGDIEDTLALAPERAWQFDYSALLLASLRYRSDATLVLRLAAGDALTSGIPEANYEARLEVLPSELLSEPVLDVPAEPAIAADEDTAAAPVPLLQTGPWQGDWQLLQGERHSAFKGSDASLAALLLRVVDEVADEFARQYAIWPSADGDALVYLRVEGVSQFGAYKNLQAYIHGLAMVTQMDVESVDGDGVLLALQLEGDLRLLASTFELSRRLQLVDAAALTLALNGSAAPAPALDAEAALAAELDALVMAQQSQETEAPPSQAPAPALGSREQPLRYQWLK